MSSRDPGSNRKRIQVKPFNPKFTGQSHDDPTPPPPPPPSTPIPPTKDIQINKKKNILLKKDEPKKNKQPNELKKDKQPNEPNKNKPPNNADKETDKNDDWQDSDEINNANDENNEDDADDDKTKQPTDTTENIPDVDKPYKPNYRIISNIYLDDIPNSKGSKINNFTVRVDSFEKSFTNMDQVNSFLSNLSAFVKNESLPNDDDKKKKVRDFFKNFQQVIDVDDFVIQGGSSRKNKKINKGKCTTARKRKRTGKNKNKSKRTTARRNTKQSYKN